MGKPYSWKARSAEVRDARHTHSGPEVAKPSAAKDTKRWCRGKVGREHVVVVVLSTKDFPRLVRCYSTCGRESGSYSGTWGKPPEWATTEDLAELAKAKMERRGWLGRFTKRSA